MILWVEIGHKIDTPYIFLLASLVSQLVWRVFIVFVDSETGVDLASAF
jgi:hypothetical protein